MRVLILSAQFPFPPRSGFETRVCQLTRQLARRHEVTLLSFAEVGRDITAAADLGPHPIDLRTITHGPPSGRSKRVGQLLTLGGATPYACREVHSRAMQEAITDLCIHERFDVIQLESSLFCQYSYPSHVKVVVDEHNIEYELLKRIARSERSLSRRMFAQVEAARFQRFERRAWSAADGLLLCSDRESEIVQVSAPQTPRLVVANGVDLEYFCPSPEEPEPLSAVFNGVLDYRPNLDAALFLVEEIWPRVLRAHPAARLSIVGRARGTAINALRRPGVEVTGEVPDVRPHLQHAAVVLAPLRMGGGTRLKVVEGLALGKAIVSTQVGCEGIAVRDREHLLMADTADAFAASVVELFDNRVLARALGRRGRALAEAEYSWDAAGERLSAFLETLGSRSMLQTYKPDPLGSIQSA